MGTEISIAYVSDLVLIRESRDKSCMSRCLSRAGNAAERLGIEHVPPRNGDKRKRKIGEITKNGGKRSVDNTVLSWCKAYSTA